MNKTEKNNRGLWILLAGIFTGITLYWLIFTRPLPCFDFTNQSTVAGWYARHDISRLCGTAEGMLLEISGDDPYAVGPFFSYPPGKPLFIKIRLKSDQPGMLQIFYYSLKPTEECSIRLCAKGGGEWEELEGILPPLGLFKRLRIDPPGVTGKAVINRISFSYADVVSEISEPAWPKPEAFTQPENQCQIIESEKLRLVHSKDNLGAFSLSVAGKTVAFGHGKQLFGYMQSNEVRWIETWKNASMSTEVREGILRVSDSISDPDGGKWKIEQNFSPRIGESAIDVETKVTTSVDRKVIYLPLLTIIPGLGSFGEKKGQAIFPGLEYLEDEPSSSDADIIGPAANRRVPDNLKITFPLMALQAEGRYIGLSWEVSSKDQFSALFDSPDRVFHSGGHIMCLFFPGSDGQNRQEGNLFPRWVSSIRASEPLVLKASIIGGMGETVIPAVQHYVSQNGLPDVPDTMPIASYVHLAAEGWLDSKLRENCLFRHALWKGFNPQPAADAAILLNWLANQKESEDLTDSLRKMSSAALEKVNPAEYNVSCISHVHYPLGSLVFGYVDENSQFAETGARNLKSSFETDGSYLYRKSPGGPDFGKTHWASETNGLTATMVWTMLEQSCVAGNAELIQESLRLVRALQKFDNTVPRGAQTWEIPLHTPDILASAYLIKVFLRAYELTGEREFLERAIYWAWTGIPFVYLRQPIPNSIGVYSTIPVLGASNWKAPVWIGQPVQWCGLVYADALYRLARYSSIPVWKKVANGITACGIQMSWPKMDQTRQGLLPDSFQLREQCRSGPAINPGTVQTNAINFYHRSTLYDFHASLPNGWLVHAPGEIVNIEEKAGRLSFESKSWLNQPYELLISGFKGKPCVYINDKELSISGPHQYLDKAGRLVLQVIANTKVEIIARNPL
ncbi:MAG: hypothetical protein HQM08_16245 [Candidatus Riflebacteria bacterium]|nr:hypothetical protein [Candidatus Riflebacteria bacterium]